MLVLATLAALTHAHPLGDQLATQTSHLRVDSGQVHVTYTAEVPEAFVATAARGSGSPFAAMQSELATGLVLLADGAVLPMRREGDWGAPVASSDHTWQFQLTLVADLPALPTTLELQTANLQDTSNVMAGLVDVQDGLRVVDCSLWARGDDGAMARNDRGRWRRDERTLSVELAAPLPGWAWVVPSPEEPIPAYDARVRSVREALGSSVPTPGLWLLTAGAALAVGLGTGREGWRSGVLPWLAIALAWLPALAQVDAGASVLLLLFGAWALSRSTPPSLAPWLWAATGAGLVASLHHPRAALLVALAWTLGAAARERTVAAGAVAAVVVAGWLGLRALV